MKISRTEILANHVRSLVWQGDTLVDWVAGGAIFDLDGRSKPSRVNWAYPFDAACATPDGRYAIIYQRCGTKALLLRDGKLLRELNRSFYQAHVYEYPVCIWRAEDGRTLIAHCPERYCQIDIEDADTGVRLTQRERKPADFFHSRLMVNANGTRLLSAGWIWHPLSAVIYYDIAEALRNPKHLDSLDSTAPGSRNVSLAEEDSACWQTAERVLLGGGSEEDSVLDPEDAAIEPRLHKRGIAVYDVVTRTYIKSFVLDEVAGRMMPVGEEGAVCFCGHPRLVSLESGEVLCRWDDLDTGKTASSIIWNATIPPLATDAANRRFAVYNDGKITVIQIDHSE